MPPPMEPKIALMGGGGGVSNFPILLLPPSCWSVSRTVFQAFNLATFTTTYVDIIVAPGLYVVPATDSSLPTKSITEQVSVAIDNYEIVSLQIFEFF